MSIQTSVALAALPLALALAACSPSQNTSVTPVEQAQSASSTSTTLAFVGANVWDGLADAAIQDAVLLVRDGRVVALGSRSDVVIPEGSKQVDVSGQWIVPGLINAHGHVGVAKGLDTDEDTAGTLENMQAQLALYARYGITSVVSLDEPNYNGVQLASGNDATDLTRARLHVSGPYLNPESPDEVQAQLAERIAGGVTWAKIRVDDQLGDSTAMDEATYREVVRQAHAAGLPVAAHIVYLRDARGLVDAGADIIAHSVRDAAVDDALMAQMRDKNICLHPTLTREVSTYVYAQPPAFFNDAFFTRDADPEVIAQLQTSEQQAKFTGRHADWYRQHLPVATANLKRLHDAGVRIAFGTDSGPPARFQGYFEHKEAAMMQQAGMPAAAILRSLTADAADCMKLENVGTLKAGNWADFVVLRADPLADIGNLRQIAQVRIAGNAIEGAAFDGH